MTLQRGGPAIKRHQWLWGFQAGSRTRCKGPYASDQNSRGKETAAFANATWTFLHLRTHLWVVTPHRCIENSFFKREQESSYYFLNLTVLGH